MGSEGRAVAPGRRWGTPRTPQVPPAAASPCADPLGKGPWSWGLWDRGSPVPCPAELLGCQAALTVTNAPNEAPN